MKQAFSREVFRQFPHLSVVENYFYEPPVNHVLCGFMCERTPDGAYVQKFVYPLYDRAGFLHLTYSNRLPRPMDFIEGRWKGRERILAAEFCRRIKPYYEEVLALRSLDPFLRYLESEIGLLHPMIRLSHAATLVHLGRRDEAIEELRSIQSGPCHVQWTHFISDTAGLMRDLEVSRERALERLCAWESESRSRYNLGGRAIETNG